MPLYDFETTEPATDSMHSFSLSDSSSLKPAMTNFKPSNTSDDCVYSLSGVQLGVAVVSGGGLADDWARMLTGVEAKLLVVALSVQLERELLAAALPFFMSFARVSSVSVKRKGVNNVLQLFFNNVTCIYAAKILLNAVDFSVCGLVHIFFLPQLFLHYCTVRSKQIQTLCMMKQKK